MARCLECETCFYCGRFVTPRHEHDHFPVPRRAGGFETVPACVDCHDLKDRFTLESWPMHTLAPIFRGCRPAEAWELLLALGHSMPTEYRTRLSLDPFPSPRPLVQWSAETLVAGVLAASTTEARLYLAKCVSLSWDMRAGTSAQRT
jgi:hypothetical protein